MSEPFDLNRFKTAQAGVIDTALAELRAGRKRSHWMWFVFPQHVALGRSSTARHYGLGGMDEARAYWADAVLGPRLAEGFRAVLGARGRSAHEIFGSPDDLKLRSCATLFEAAVPDEPLFGQVLDACFGAERDPLTLALLAPPR
jgi:uncharacterized protein (DUF1810 family)